MKQTQGGKSKEIYFKKVVKSWIKPLKSWTKQLYYDAYVSRPTFRIPVKIIQAAAGHIDDPE